MVKKQEIFNVLDGLIYGLSKKIDGDMKLWPDEENIEVKGNRKWFLQDSGINPESTVSALGVHADKVHAVCSFAESYEMKGYDALMTSIPLVTLTLTVADCVPVYVFDSKLRVIALIHSGWRGTILNIVGKTIAEMKHSYGSNPHDLQVFIGPHIKDCHFEVGPEIAEQFPAGEVSVRDDKFYVYLDRAIVRQLSKAGLLKKNIFVTDICTYCDDLYYSHRRDKFEKVKAGLAYFAMEF